MSYSKKVANYLSHPENRIKICQANKLLFSAKGDEILANAAWVGFLAWIEKAQDRYHEDHF